MLRLFGKIADWIVDYKRTTLSFIIIWTAMMSVGHINPYLFRPYVESLKSSLTRWSATEADSEASRQSEAKKEQGFSAPPERSPPDVSPVQITGGDVIVVAESDSFFTPNGIRAMRQVVRDL